MPLFISALILNDLTSLSTNNIYALGEKCETSEYMFELGTSYYKI